MELITYRLRPVFPRVGHGSHHIFSKDGIPEIINLQPRPDGSVKRYQLRQVRELFSRYGLAREVLSDE